MQVFVRIPEKNNPLKFEQKMIFDSKIHKALNKSTINKYTNVKS